MQNYKNVKTIGKGSFGYAVLVRHKQQPDKFYVMKMIDIKKMSQKQREEACNEIKILKSLNNPFIIRYRESFEEKNVLCIVMDFANGGDLYNMINYYKNKNMYIPENIIIQIFTEICIALNHVHSNKILHRDLKTQNIFLTKQRHVKLGDFGISRVLQHTYDQARTAIGTPYYLSPEICEEKPYNHKSDVWSVGCILYEMMSRTHAFDALSMKVLVIKILNGKYPPPPQHYSENLKILLKSLLQRDPNKRPSIEQILYFPGIYDQVRLLEEEYGKCFLKETEIKKEKQIQKRDSVKEKVVLQYRSPKRSKSFVSEQKVRKNKEIKNMKSEIDLRKRTKSLLCNSKNKKDKKNYSQRDKQQNLVKKLTEKIINKVKEQKEELQYYSEQNKIKQQVKQEKQKDSNTFIKQYNQNLYDKDSSKRLKQENYDLKNNFYSNCEQSKSKKLNPIVKVEEEKNIFDIEIQRKQKRNRSSIWSKRNLAKSLEKKSQLIEKKVVERDRPKTPGQNIKNKKNKSKKILFEFLSKEQQKKKIEKQNENQEIPKRLEIQQQNIEKPRLRTNFFNKSQNEKQTIVQEEKINYQSIPQQTKNIDINKKNIKYQSIQQNFPVSKENQEINQILEKYWKNQIFEESQKQKNLQDDKIKIDTDQLFSNLPIDFQQEDSLSYKIELVRIYLEKKIGLEKLLNLYHKLIDEKTLDENIQVADHEHIPLITQLIYLEEKYVIMDNINFKVEAIYFAEFDIHAGPLLKFIATDQKFMEDNIQKHFESWKDFLTPDEELCGKFVRIFMDQDYSVLSQAIQKQSDRYERKKIVFTVAFVVHNKIFEFYKETFQFNINKLYNYFIGLEQNDLYLSQNNYKVMDEIIQVIFKQLKTDNKIILVNNNQICYLLFTKNNLKEQENINKKIILGRQHKKNKLEYLSKLFQRLIF